MNKSLMNMTPSKILYTSILCMFIFQSLLLFMLVVILSGSNVLLSFFFLILIFLLIEKFMRIEKTISLEGFSKRWSITAAIPGIFLVPGLYVASIAGFWPDLILLRIVLWTFLGGVIVYVVVAATLFLLRYILKPIYKKG